MKPLKDQIRRRLQRFLHLDQPRSRYEVFAPWGWSSRNQGDFNKASKAYLFRAMASQFNTNPVGGDYLEFGCCGAYTMRMAWDYLRNGCPEMRYVGFDSFEGFPKIKDDDKGHWQEGDLAMSEQDFTSTCLGHGLPPDRLETVKGFYDQSLANPQIQAKYHARPAAVIYIDVDVYSPAKCALDFARPMMRRGTIIAFDDWNAFYADDQYGERRAWREFAAEHPELRFSEFVATHFAQTFICLGQQGDDAND